MAGPSDRGGFTLNLPDASDSARDALGYILAILRGDDEGQAAILANADLESLVHLLGAMVAGVLTANVSPADPDAAPGALTEEQLQHAEAILIAAVEGPDDDLGQ